MAIEAGQQLLHYRLTEKIGQGGMGVVWKAVDTDLDREVAIKILPEAFAQAPERLARFEREAKLLAALNHPNIATIHGLHETDGLHFLVMEMIGGEDLADRLSGGALAFDRAIEIAEQTAAALAAAHDSGVIHRDLKPANIRVNQDGAVKVLDFGLAKLLESGSESSSMSESPTMTSVGSAAGTILGTASYMSPEQARGKELDRRTDVWSLGCVLYESLTGRQAFPGETVTDILAGIVHKEPDWGALPEAAGPRVDRLLRRCLSKDSRDRMRDMGDVALLLREIRNEPSQKVETTTVPVGTAVSGAGWLRLAGVGVLAIAVGIWLGGRILSPDNGSSDSVRVTAMVQTTDLPGVQQWPSLSPDGKMLLYTARDGGDQDIFLQRVGGETTINLTAAFDSDDFDAGFSPQGDLIAFCSNREGGGIFIMGATGESPRQVSDEGVHPTWSPDGTRLAYGNELLDDPYSRQAISEIWIVDIETGQRTRLTEGDAVEPSWSPDGKRIAYWMVASGYRDILTIPSTGGTPSVVTSDPATDWAPIWSADGRWLMFISDRGGSPDLWRIRIDETSGAAVGMPEPLTTGTARLFRAAASADGSLLAATVAEDHGEILHVKFDPVSERLDGTPETIMESSHRIRQTHLSPDGRSLAYRTTAPVEDLFTVNLDGGRRRQLTMDPFRDRGPFWSPDGEWLTFYSNRGGSYDLWALRRNGTDLRQLTNIPEMILTLPVVSPDGRRASAWIHNQTEFGTVFLDAEGWFDSSAPAVVTAAEFDIPDFNAIAWSPDGKALIGLHRAKEDRELAFYTLESGKLLVLRHADGGTMKVDDTGVAWFRDNRRVIFWDLNRNQAFVGDSVSGDVRPVPGVPGPSELQLSADNRTLIATRTISESDIWLLTLSE